MSGDGPGRSVCGMLPPGAGLLAATEDPPLLPDWLPAEALAYAVGEFKRTGFRGGLNWYRNLRRNAELLAPWRGCGIAQPSLFIGGTRDDVLRFPGATDRLEKLPALLTDLRGSHVIEGAGHWIQQGVPERSIDCCSTFSRRYRGLRAPRGRAALLDPHNQKEKSMSTTSPPLTSAGVMALSSPDRASTV
jgi:pimeloyl-ACP methyl ester carboxylesterase